MRIPTLWISLCLGIGLVGCENESASGPSSTAQVTGAGWSFGFCLGPCRGDLELAGAELTYRVSDRTEEQVFVTNHGSLTSRGRGALESLANALPESLLDTYGCPDCADAGAAYVVVERATGTAHRSNYEYPNPPAELEALDGFLKAVMEALGSCVPTEDVSLEAGCVPLPN